VPSSISHVMAVVAIGSALAPRRAFRPLVLAGAVCAILPDADALPRIVGRGDLAFMGGHRVFTHSILFAIIAGSIVALCFADRWGTSRWRVFAFISLATLSHGTLDAFSDFGSGIGVAFLSPFVHTRFVAPWQPIAGEFCELFWCLLPLMLLAGVGLRLRKIPLRISRGKPIMLPRLSSGQVAPAAKPQPAAAADSVEP
jgi:inner membrane protein